MGDKTRDQVRLRLAREEVARLCDQRAMSADDKGFAFYGIAWRDAALAMRQLVTAVESVDRGKESACRAILPDGGSGHECGATLIMMCPECSAIPEAR